MRGSRRLSSGGCSLGAEDECVLGGCDVWARAVAVGERLERVATLEVFGFVEARRLMANCEFGCGVCGAAGAGILCAGEPGGGDCRWCSIRLCWGGLRWGRHPIPGWILGGVLGVYAGEWDEGGECVDGAPATVSGQVRTQLEAQVKFDFETWGRLQMALAAGSQSMNLLTVASGAAANGSGGVAEAAVLLQGGSTASSLVVGSAASGFSVGDLVAVDVDYAGQIGFVGSGVSGAYVKAVFGGRLANVNYVRRVSLNVGRVASIAGGALGLEVPLAGGRPGGGDEG